MISRVMKQRQPTSVQVADSFLMKADSYQVTLREIKNFPNSLPLIHAAHVHYQKKRLDEIKMSSLKKCLQGDLLESEQAQSYSTVSTQSQQVNITEILPEL